MKLIPSFFDFLNEKKSESIEKEAQDYVDKKGDACPRCGEKEGCDCQESDPWSTANYHRVPKGEKMEFKSKQKFKK